jgi:hypothetical protein
MLKEKISSQKDSCRQLATEDRQYDWTLSPPDTRNGCRTHLMKKSAWAGDLQNEFGAHRRGPNKDWY